MRLWLILSTIIWSSSGVAQQSAADPCQDLAAISCGDSVVHDGTGEVKKLSDKEVQERLSRSLTEVLQASQREFQSFTRSSSGAYFRDLLLEMSSPEVSEKCKTSTQNLSQGEACGQALYETYLSQIVSKSFRYGPDLLTLPTPLFGGVADFKPGQFRTVMQIEQLPWHQQFILKTQQRLYANTSNKDLRRGLGSQVAEIKELMLAEIRMMPLEDKLKEKMLAKVSSVFFEGTMCNDLGSVGSSTTPLNSFFTPNAFYHPQKNSIAICEGTLGSVSSQFSLVGSIAHELAHAVDPCHVKGLSSASTPVNESQTAKESDAKSPYKELLRCLRSPKSVGAEFVDMSAVGSRIQTGKSIFEPILSDEFGHDFCSGSDPVVEAFADWLGVSVASQHFAKNHEKLGLSQQKYRDGYSNFLKQTCWASGDRATRAEVRASVRINRLLATNPLVRSQMGCASELKGKAWCTLELSGATVKTPHLQNKEEPGIGTEGTR